MSNIRIVLTLDGKQYQAELDRAAAGTRRLRQEGERLGTTATLMANALRTAGASITVFGAVQLVRQVSDMNVQFDRARIALNAVSNSSQQAGQRFQFVLNTAERLGVQNLSLAQGYVVLTAAARGTNLEGAQTDKIFSAIVESGARLNISQADIQGILRATQQIMSKGTLSAEELRQQLGDRLPGAVNIAARALGVTTAQLNEMLIRGEIASDVFLPKFADELRRTFGTDSTTRIDTNAASFQRLRNEISLLADSIGSVLNPVLADSSNQIANVLRLLREKPAAGAGLLLNAASPGGMATLMNAANVYAEGQRLQESARAAMAGAQRVGPDGLSFDFLPGLPRTNTDRVSTPEFYGALRPEMQALNEEQQKAVDKAREHYELLKLTTEESRVLYQIRSGSLRDTTKQEQDFLLAAARLRDAQAAEQKTTEEAGKAAADARRAAADAARTERQRIEEETRIAESDLQRALRAEENARDETRRRVDALVGRFSPQGAGRGFRRDLRSANSLAEINARESEALRDADAIWMQNKDDIDFDRDDATQRGIDVNGMEVRAWREHEDEKTRITREAEEARRKLMMEQLGVAEDLFGNLADLAGSFGERGFKAYKAFSILQATASMITGAIGAYSRAVEALPPGVGQAVGVASAAAVIAANTVKIAQIRSLEYGGGRERGGAVQRDRFYEIGERGRPEIVESAGRFFMFDAQGRVNAARSGGGGAPTWTIQIIQNARGVEVRPSISQRPDGGGVVQLVVNAMQRDLIEEGPFYKTLKAKTGLSSRPVSRG